MPYLDWLIDRAVVRRGIEALNDLRERVLDYEASGAVVASDVHCRLVFDRPRILEEIFGKNIEADGVVYFGPGQDVRPTSLGTEGKSDLLVITQRVNGQTSRWWCVSAVDAGQRGRGVVAAVRRWSQ